MLTHGWWFSPGTPVSSTTKTGHHDIAEILLKCIKHNKSINQINALFFVCGFRYKKETAIRINTDGTTINLKDENDRLRKERNRAKIDVDRITREKEELAQELQNEIDAAKVEHDNLKKDKNEFTSIFQQKIYQLEKERETLVAR